MVAPGESHHQQKTNVQQTSEGLNVKNDLGKLEEIKEENTTKLRTSAYF